MYVNTPRGVFACSRRRRPSALSRLAFAAHELGAERALGLVLVVRPASKPDPRDRGLATAREFSNVIELEPRSGFATTPGIAHERALTVVPLPDGAPHVRGDVARARARAPVTKAGPGARGELLLLELADERLQGALDHRSDPIACWAMTEQRLGVSQILVGGLANGQLQRVTLRSHRRHPGLVGRCVDTPRGVWIDRPRGNGHE